MTSAFFVVLALLIAFIGGAIQVILKSVKSVLKYYVPFYIAAGVCGLIAFVRIFA